MATESRRKGIKLVIALCVIVALAVTGVLIWTSRRATIRFYNLDDVESNLTSMSVSIGGTIDQPKDPVAKDQGYSFGGWYSDPNCLTEFDFDLPIQKDTTIYVKWVRKSFTVTVLRATTGGNFYEVLWTGSAKYKESISLPGTSTFMNYSWMGADDARQYPFRRANQNFLGFATRDNGIGDYNYTYLPDSSFTIPNTSVQLYAVFRGDERSFIFKPNDGEGTEKTEKGYFNENFTVPTSEGLSKKYYTFAYWCTNADGIPRDSEGNTLADVVDPVTGEVTEKAENNENCVNVYWPGQTFKINNTEPMTLYAIWKRNKVNIMIDARGGLNSLGTDGDNLVDAGLEGGYDLSTITKPTRDGYRLISYNTQENGLGTTYSLDAVLQVEEEDIALYAIWQRHLTIGYTLNTNKASDDKLTEAGGYEDFVGIDGESFTVKDIPVTVDIPNFRFLGWSLDSEATQAEYHSGDTFVLRESDFDGGVDKIYLYGIWQGDARVLRLKNTSDNQIQEISSYFGRLERLTTTPVNVDVNYMFVGWGTVEEYNYKNPDSYTGRIYEVGSQFEMGTNTEIGESRDILYSLWCPYSYDITYYTQGGRLTAISAEDQANGYYIKDYVYKETITLYSQVEREGYRFMGWAYSSNSQECAFPTEGENGYTLVMPGNPIQLYAVWQKEYTVTFYNNADDASGLVTAITGKILGETITIPTKEVSNAGITRDNYTIIGWGSKPDGGTVYDFGTEVVLASSDMISYYAIWQGDARYVEVYNGVTKVATIEGHYGEDIPLAFEEEIADADPGQEIGGFYAMIKTSPTTEATRYDFAYGSNIKTTTLYFKDENGAAVNTLKVYIEWTNKYFSVVYELNGGIYNNDDNDDMSAYRIYKQYTTEVTLESGIPTKTRYEFKGWTETPDDDNPVLYAAGGKFVIPSHDVTLYAYWARIYSINFNSNGGTLAEGADESDLKAGSYSKGTNFIVPNNVYERTNYTFKCWSTRASGATSAGGEDYNVGDTLTITSDITLYAVWQGQEVNVTLISVDPGNAAYDTRTVQITPTPRYGDTISLGTYSSVIPAPDQGLTLKGWVIGRQPTELDIEVEYTNDYTIDSVGNIEIYAVWSAKKFYFTVGLSGGVCNNSYSDQAESYAFRQKIDMTYYSNRIKKEGYRLIGYSNTANATDADYAVDSVISMPNAGKKVFCVWIELAIITFDKNCESDTLENYVFEGVPNDAIDGEINLTNVNKMFTRDNYTLLGWSTSSTATTPDAGFSIDNDTYRILSTQDIHLFAVWEGRAIQVVFNANGGQGSNTQEQRKYGDVIDLTVDKYKRTHSDEGFSFGGWSRVAGYDNANSTVGSSFTVATDDLRVELITLYAIWNKRYFTLTLSYGDSTLGSKATPDGYDSRQVQYTSTIDLTQYVTQAKKRLGYDFLGWAENQYETNASKIYGAPDADGNPTNVTFTMPNSAVTLYALWNPIYVDVIYISDTPSGATATWSGVTPGVQSYTSKELYQLSFKLPSNKITESVSVVVPTYRFVGWILDGDSTQTIRKEGNWLQVSSRSPMTLRAQWEENRITVSVNGNGGIFTASSSGTLQVSVKEMGTYTLPTATELVRAGYRLSGYTVGGNRYDLAANPTIQITTSLIDQADIASNTVRITMLWIQQFTVSFNANNKYNDGTTGTIDDKTVDSGTAIVLPNCSATEGFNRPHYKFLYWNTQPDGKGTTYNAGNSVTVYASYTLYAIWEGDDRQITLNFSTNKVGKWSGGDVTTKTFSGLKYGDEIDLGKTDYTGECTEDAGFKLGGWTDIPYTGNDEIFKVKFLFGSIYTVEGDDASPNIQLYAVWEARSYKVSYDTNGGVFSDGSNRKDGTEIAYGNNFTVDGSLVGYNPSATKQFYTLVGWSIDRNFDWNKKNTRPVNWEEPSNSYNYIYKSGDTSSEKAGFKMPSKDVVLYAIWEPVQINISIYNDKDSMGTVSDTQTVRYGDTYTLRTISEVDAAQIKPDHNFDKWQHLNTDKSTILGSYAGGTTLKISEELMSENEAIAPTKTIIFVGTWIPQTVYFVIDGNEGLFGENNTHTVQSSVGREIVLPKVKETDTSYQLTRENFALDSFNTTRNGSGANYKPGATIQIPSLNDSRVKEETITFGDEEITTYVFRVYAQWQEAEAYIYLSDTRKENPFYKTLGEAIDDAATGNRVIIIKDCYIKNKITISKSVTIEAEDSDKNIYRYIGTEDNSFADAYKGVCIEVTTTGQLNVGVDSEDYEGPVVYFDGQSGKYTTVVESFIVLKGSATIYNGVVFRNTYAATGGAFSVNDTNASLVLKYVSFDTNMADGNGGAIAVTKANNISISNSNFYGNVSKTGFGGAISNGGTLDLQANLFERNQAARGGAIYNTGDVTDRNNIYNINIAQNYGGAIYNSGNLYSLTGGDTGYAGNAGGIFTNNTSNTAGGAVYNDATTGTADNMIISNVTFGVDDDIDYEKANSANSGGAVFNAGKINISSSRFYFNNTVDNGEGGAIGTNGTRATLLIKGCTLKGNKSNKGNGGALYVASGIATIGEDGASSSVNTFIGNSVTTGKGHAMVVAGGTVNVYYAIFREHVFTENSNYGGVVNQNGGVLNFFGGTITENTLLSIDSNDVGGYGGGLLISNGTCNIKNLTIDNNTAKYGGGIAIIGSGSVVMTNGEIYANKAGLGGGIYLRDSNSSLTLNGGIIGAPNEEQGNQAVGFDDSNLGLGGGIYAKGTVNINGATIRYNYSNGNGGGIYTNGILNLVSGKINNNSCARSGGAIYADATGGGTNGSVRFKCSSSVSFVIEGNLCADGSYPLCVYDESSVGYANGIYTETKVIISGYMVIGYNSDESILNDIFLAVRDTATNPTSKIVVFDSGESYKLNAQTKICISSIVAVMGDKLVLFPSVTDAKNEIGKFSFAGDDAGFRLDEKYLKLGNYAATIIRGGNEVFYSTLTEAYLDAVSGETINVYKNIVLTNDLAVYEESNGLADIQEAALGDNKVAGVSIQDTFYISKKITLVSGGDYSITRGDLTGDMFTVVGDGQLILGTKTPGSTMLTIKGGGDVTTGSIVKVEFSESFTTGALADEYQLTVYNGAKLTQNKAEKGGAIYNLGKVVVKGGDITRNKAESDDGGLGGGIYSEGSTSFLYLTEDAKISYNTAYEGGGIFINSDSDDSNALVMDSETAAVTYNTSTYAGGGIYIQDGAFNMTAGEISYNTSNEMGGSYPGGGGVYLASGSSMTTNAKAANNETNAAYIQIKNNKTKSAGGGVAVDNATFTFNIGYITENNATVGGGVAIINTSNAEGATGKFISKNTGYFNHIVANTATNGGAINIVKGSATLSYIKIIDNKASNGAGIYVEDTLSVGYRTYVGDASTGKGNTAEKDGGGIFISNDGSLTQFEGNTSSAQNLIVSANEATTGMGGGICNYGTITFNYFTDIYGNRAATGGGIANAETSSKLYINAYGMMYRNTATGEMLGGGGLYNIGLTQLNKNYLFGSSGTIADGNSAVRGGGIYNVGDFIVGSETEKKAVGGVNISFNTATLFGGGLYMSNGRFVDYNTSTFSIKNNAQTLAAGGGGGICIDGGTVITKYYPHSKETGMANNGSYMYVNSNSSNGTGGGILITGTSDNGVILNSVFSKSNSATGRGGGLAVLGASKVYLGSESLGDNNGLSYFCDNTSSVGAGMYLDTVLTIESSMYAWWYGAAKDWVDEIYLANPRAYLDFKKKASNDKESYYPAVNQLNIRANSYTDGRRIAKFSSYIKVIQEVGASGGMIDVEYTTTFAEDYYKKFVCNVANNYGVGYDDNGYVVFAEPVAYNYSRGTYHATLAQACEAASNGHVIAILKSHTITDQVKIIDKGLYFVNSTDIILTRSPKLMGDMFRIFGSNLNNGYTVYFNYNWGNVSSGPLKGTKCGDSTLTLDGNKDNPTLKQQTINKWGEAYSYGNYASRGSLIGLNGGLYSLDENNKVVPYTTNASHLFGHKVVQPSENLYVNGSKITTTTHGNWNVWPARIGLNIRNTSFKNNFSAYAGGAITYKGYSSSSTYCTLSVQNCTFENNETGYYSWQSTTRGEWYSFYQSGAGGGAIFALGGYSDIRNCTFTDNTSASHGGAISSILQECGNSAGFYITNCTFSNNKALYGNGGAIEIISNKGNISWDNMFFYNNSAYTKGGAVYFTRTTKTYQDLIDEGYVYGNGHNIYVGTFEEKSTPEGYVNNCINSGSVEAWSTIEGKAHFNLSSNCVFEGNSVGKGYWGKEVTTTNGDGGAIYARHYLRVETSGSIRIEGNTATNNGGGIYAQYVPRFRNSSAFKVSSNTAKNYGGGIYFSEIPNYCTSIVVDGNTANYGGGVYFAKRGSIYNVTLTNNIANKSGGGVYFSASVNNSVRRCTISRNSAVEYGGGIAAPNSGSTSIGLCVSGGGEISYNKTGLAGGGIYCYGSLAVIGDSTISIIENEVYSTKSDLGGGGGLWSYWEVMISGTVSFLNNKVTSPTPLNRGGGGAIFLYLDELWLTAATFYKSGGNTSSYNDMENWRAFPNDYLYFYKRSNHGLTKYSSGNDWTWWKDSSDATYTWVSGSNGTISISGNDSGVSAADGIYYWGSNMYVSGNLKVTDEVYFYNSSATINIDNYINSGESQPMYIRYPNNPNDGTVMVRADNYVYLNSAILGIFNVDNDGYYTEFSGTYGNPNARKSDVAKVTVKKGSVSVIVNADIAKGETVNGMGSISVQVGFGDAMTTVYQKVKPSYPGHRLKLFQLLNADGSVRKELWLTSGWFFPTKSEIVNWFGTVPENITLKTVWYDDAYTLTIGKAIDNGVGGWPWGNSTRWNTSNNTGNANYTYQIGSNESMRGVMEWLETTASTVDPTVKKNYLEGYTFSHYMLDDRKIYTKEDFYPYTNGRALYMCFVKSTYKLTFTAGADGELLTTNNVLTVKYQANATMLSGNLVYRSGYKLKAWLGSDGQTYELNKNYNKFTQDMTFEPIWDATTYQVRVYYNYPDGGTSFKVYSVYAGELLAGKLNQSPIANPMGYTLKGYATAASSSTEGYQEIDETYEMPGQDLIVYAQWSPIKVVISYYDEKQLNLLYQEEVDFGTDIELAKITGVTLWLNVGSQTVYNPGGSYYVSNTGQYYLIFRAYSLSS